MTENGRKPDGYGRYAQTGLELAAAVLLGFWGGYWLDGKLGTLPWLTLGGAAAGLGGGFYLAARELFDIERPVKKDGK